MQGEGFWRGPSGLGFLGVKGEVVVAGMAVTAVWAVIRGAGEGAAEGGETAVEWREGVVCGRM